MPVIATQVNGETVQAIGSRAQFLIAAESSWGTAPATATRQARVLAGETMDQNIAVYASKQLRGDRMRNPPARGTMDPGGSIPFELSQDGWNWALFSLLLPSAVTTTGPTLGAADPATPPGSINNLGSGGASLTGTFYYQYTGVTAAGETRPSPASTSVSATAQVVQGTLTLVTNATSYNIYRSTSSSGPFGLVTVGVTGTAWVDQSLIPGAPPPGENTAGQQYVHLVNAGTTGTPLPIGFSFEKQFSDLPTPVYELFSGCKVSRMQLNFGIDKMVDGTIDVVAKSFTASTTANFTNYPRQQTYAPYTGANIVIYEAGTTNPLGLCTDLQLTIDNSYKKASGFILGSTTRQNLKPGTRMIDFVGKFMFQDLTLYNKAVNGTNSALKIVCNVPANTGTYSHTFQMGTIQFTPNQSAPRVHDDGPLEITLRGLALFDPLTNTDLQLTIVSGEASIIN